MNVAILRQGAEILTSILFVGLSVLSAQTAPDNTLTQAESAAGWILLFDGADKNTHWQIDMDGGPGSNTWIIEDEAMTVNPGSDGSELYTLEEYDNFEFSMDWKINQGGNSGIWFRATDQPSRICSASEYAILDGPNHEDGTSLGKMPGETEMTIRTTASNYDLYPTTVDGIPGSEGGVFVDATNPVGEYNTSILWANGKFIEHYLNGQLVVNYEIGTDDWIERFNNSKYPGLGSCSGATDTWGRHESGYLGIQDHGHGLLVWVKNIKIRPITPGEKLVQPLMTPAGGEFTDDTTITLESGITGANIYYTLDGSDPNEQEGMLYSEPIQVTATTTIRAVTLRETFETSDVSTGTYTLAGSHVKRGHANPERLAFELQQKSLHFRGELKESLKVNIRRITGKILLSITLSPEKNYVDLAWLQSGLYILELENPVGKSDAVKKHLFFLPE